MTKPTRALLTLILPALWALTAPADTLFLREGEETVGRLVEITPSEVRFETDGGLLTLDKRDVVRIQLQRARKHDDVNHIDQITDPDLEACLANLPPQDAYPAAGYITLLRRRTLDLRSPERIRDTTRKIVQIREQRGEEAGTSYAWYFEDADEPHIGYALTVTQDGRVLHLNDAAMKDESLYAQWPEYRRQSRLRFSCKEPRPGNVLDVEYTVDRSRGPLNPFYVDALFRNGEPLLRKEVIVIVREEDEKELVYEQSGPDVVAFTREAAEGVVRLTWRLEEPQPGVVPEPHQPPMAAYAPRLTVAERTGWAELAAAYGAALRALPPLPEAWARKAVELDQAGGAAAIYSHVARNVRTLPVPHWRCRITPHAPGITADRGLANELDKHFLFSRMLDAAGVPNRLALVRARGQGPLPMNTPSLRAFGRSAVYVEPDECFVFAANNQLAYGVLPDELQGAPALVAGSPEPLAWTQQPAPEVQCETRAFNAALDAAGDLTLEIRYSGTGTTGAWMRGLKDVDEQQIRVFCQRVAGSLHPAAELVHYATSDLADLSETSAITLQCAIPGYAMKAGDALMLFELPALDYTAQDVGRPVREFDLFFDSVYRSRTAGRIQLPEGYALYAAPEPVDFDAPVAAYTAAVTQEDGALLFSDSYDLKAADAPAEAYGDYKTSRELRAALARRRVILKQK